MSDLIFLIRRYFFLRFSAICRGHLKKQQLLADVRRAFYRIFTYICLIHLPVGKDYCWRNRWRNQGIGNERNARFEEMNIYPEGYFGMGGASCLDASFLCAWQWCNLTVERLDVESIECVLVVQSFSLELAKR